MPQYDPYTDRVLSIEEMIRYLQDAIRAKDWRKAEHYATLLSIECGEIAFREELEKAK